MSAETVWSCINTYRYNTAQEIVKLYSYNLAEILAVLNTYPAKDEYHGHESGTSGDAMNSAAEVRLGKAIQYLRDNKPLLFTPVSKPPSSYSSSMKATASRDATKILTDIISEHNDFGLIQSLLASKNPRWKENRIAWEAYCFKYREKKGKNPVK